MTIGKIIKDIIWFIIRRLGLGPWILRWYPNSYLRKIGWFRSFRESRPVYLDGDPLPWLNYSFIHFIEAKIMDKLRVFEFGTGYSTLWWSKRTKEIVSIEHNLKWATKISLSLPDNAQVLYSKDNEFYTQEILNHGLFDIIIVDGILRNECVPNALEALATSGVIIFDNSDRNEYSSSLQLLIERGFKEIPFIGLAPANFNITKTSVFYKDNNCLGI